MNTLLLDEYHSPEIPKNRNWTESASKNLLRCAIKMTKQEWGMAERGAEVVCAVLAGSIHKAVEQELVIRKIILKV